jgi:hypothetical protein
MEFSIMNFTYKHLILAGSLGAVATIALAQDKPPPGDQLSGPEGLNHFQCYRIAPGPIGHAPVPITTVDQFGKQEILLGEPIQICNPTVKYHKGKMFGVTNGKAHMMCYSILKPQPNAGHTVQTGNQFYNRTYKTGVRTMFCAPTFKKLIGEKEYPLEGN